MNKKLLSISMMIIILFSCGKETIIEEEITPIIDPPTELVQGSIYGAVLDLEGLPVSGALVSCGNMRISTDNEGQFKLSDVDLFADGTLVDVEKEGFFFSSKRFIIQENEINYVQFNLIPRESAVILNSGQGGEVEFQDAVVKLPPGTYKDENGDDYNGEIRVLARWLDPGDEQISQAFPGGNVGLDLDDELRSLESYSAFVIEIVSSSGQQLSLPEGTVGDFELPIQDFLATTAPDVLPTWFYDQMNGIWVESEEVNKVNNKYVGVFSHAGFWACSDKHIQVQLTGQLHMNNMPLQSTRIKVADLMSSFSLERLTSSDGAFAFSVPAGRELIIEVFQDCSNAVFAHEIGILQADENLGVVEFVNNGSETQLTGAVRGCSGEVLENGFIKLDLKDRKFMFRTDAQGNYSLNFSECQFSNATICALDLNGNRISSIIEFPITSIVSLPDLVTCQDYTNSLSVDYNGMDWSEELRTEAEHSWTITSIQSSVKRYIVSPRIFNSNATDTEYLAGAFFFNENEDTATYTLEFPTQGFMIEGSCTLEHRTIGSADVLNFKNGTSTITVLDDNLYPGNVTDVDFDLTYIN